MAYISAKNLAIGYDGVTVCNDINFEVNSGDYVCIVGENGAGKSTLVKTMLGLLKPINGQLFLEDLAKNAIGYLPQQIQFQKDFPASVEEIVISGFQGKKGLRPFYNQGEKNEAWANMKRMGIIDLRKRSYRQLSGGQQQRVLLARALCASQKLLLLDEPVAGLDPKVTADMYELISGLNKDGMTIIMISHDISQALKYGTHILHVNTNTYFGTKEAYLKTSLGKGFLNTKEAQTC